MVDQVSSRTTPAVAPIVGAARVSAPQKIETSAPQAGVTATPSLARAMAASAPVDVDRVARIKDAIAQGKFPLSPTTVADSLIALKYEWMSHDEA